MLNNETTKTKDRADLELLSEAVRACGPRTLLKYLPLTLMERPDLSDTQIETLANIIGRIPHEKKWNSRNE